MNLVKIGILTFQFADNYGALLQAYALKQYLSKNGDQVEIINYANKKLSAAYDIKSFKHKNIFQTAKSLIMYPFRSSQAKLFKRFRQERLGIRNPQVFGTELQNGYDCYIVGSDQVWNSKITFNDYNYFLENISSAEKKISYAASADDEFLMDSDNKRKLNCLREFDAISVRESQMSDVLWEKGTIESEVVLDPVFLLQDTEWCRIAKHPRKKIQEKYIIYYSLKQNEYLDKTAKHLSAAMELPIIIVHPTLRKITSVGYPALDIGPEQFVWLIKNAELVVSNSFHAFSFAYIFRKKIYFDYTKEGSNRIANLINAFDLSVVHDGTANCIDMDQRNDALFQKCLNRSKMFIERNIIADTK